MGPNWLKWETPESDINFIILWWSFQVYKYEKTDNCTFDCKVVDKFYFPPLNI